jgi:mRNA interferase RelE/StbE
MKYELIVKPSAEREIDRLPRALQRRVVEALARIQQGPRGPGTVKLTGTKSTYRVRVGDWRIVYEIDDSAQTVFITMVAHRREVYR